MRGQLTVIPQLEKKLEAQEKLLSSISETIITLSRALRKVQKNYAEVKGQLSKASEMY